MKEHTAEEFQEELDKLQWQPLSDFIAQNPNNPDWSKNPPYLLFRTSDIIKNDKGVFAAPVIKHAHISDTNIRLKKTVKNFPYMHSRIVRVFTGDKDNSFYQDGGIEQKRLGIPVKGTVAENIEKFDSENLYFETELTEHNKEIKDFVYILLTTKPSFNAQNPFNYNIAKLNTDSTLYKMLSDNEMQPNANNLMFHRGMGME